MMCNDLRSAAVQARELADLLDGYLNSPQQVALGEELRSVLDSALAAAPAPQPTGDELRAMLVKARAGLANGLWDYGPGQDEHEQCDALIAEIDAVLAASPSPQHDGPSDAEMLDWAEKVNPVIFHKGCVGDKWEVCPDPESDKSFLGDTLREAIRAAMRETGGKTE